MRIPGSRTRAKLLQELRGLIFDAGNFQKLIDARERHQLEDSMGFRGQWDNHRQFQVDFLKRQGLKPSHSLLEIGCGPLTAGIPLIQYLDSNKYVGVDIRNTVLDLSHREIGKAKLSNKNPRLICSASFGDDVLPPEQTFDVVYSFSVLFHLSDEILDHFFAALSRRFAPAGKALANINTHVPSDRWLEFPFIQRKVQTYRDLAAKHGLSTEDLGTLESLGFTGTGVERLNNVLCFKMNS